MWWSIVKGSSVFGIRCIPSIIMHGSLISLSYCHAVRSVVFSEVVEQRLLGGDCPWLKDICVWICGCVENEGGSTPAQPNNGCAEHSLSGYHLCIMRGFLRHCWLNPVGSQMSP